MYFVGAKLQKKRITCKTMWGLYITPVPSNGNSSNPKSLILQHLPSAFLGTPKVCSRIPP